MAKRVPASDGLNNPLERFPPRLRERVGRCAAISHNVGQLAYTFPLLLYALATGYGPHEARLAAIKLIEQGRPLAEVAAALGLPVCLRCLPPEACPDRLDWAHYSANFNRLIANHVPSSMAALPNWLAAVSHAARLCDEHFAIWTARQRLLAESRTFDPRTLLPLALFAWHSQRRDLHCAGWPFAPWSPRTSYKTAVVEAKHWLNRVKLYVYLGDQPIADTWLDGASVCGFEFVPLVSADDIINERIAMKNCVDGYGEKLAFHHCRLFGIRCLGERVALLEIVPSGGDVPQIAQLKGPQNSDVASEVRHAACVWLRRQSHRRIAHQEAPSETVTMRKLHSLLLPYWTDIASRGPLQVAKPPVSLSQLDGSLVALAEIGAISGWPFSRRC